MHTQPIQVKVKSEKREQVFVTGRSEISIIMLHVIWILMLIVSIAMWLYSWKSSPLYRYHLNVLLQFSGPIGTANPARSSFALKTSISLDSGLGNDEELRFQLAAAQQRKKAKKKKNPILINMTLTKYSVGMTITLQRWCRKWWTEKEISGLGW